jgi:hypothetical protein
VRSTRSERIGDEGSVILLVAVGLALVIGMVGLAMDAGQMYVMKQRAQAAADSAAQAGVMDMYNFISVAQGDCPSAGGSAACFYARQNGFGADCVNSKTRSCVNITFPPCASPCPWILSGSDSPNLIRVTVQKAVDTTLLRVLSGSLKYSTISATATAAIAVTPSPLPILVIHPTLPASFSSNGSNAEVVICGGPARAIQVNSADAGSIPSNFSGKVDLTHAGPLDNGDCVAGTGADLGNVGGPIAPFPGTAFWGTKPGVYVQPSSILRDPLLPPSVIEPVTQPPAAPLPASYTTALTWTPHNCPVACKVYSPGFYDTGIQVSGFAVFRPGIYWINHGGFQVASNAIVRMAKSGGIDDSDPLTETGWSLNSSDPAKQAGILIYNKPSPTVSTKDDILSITASAGKLNICPDKKGICPSPGDCPAGGNCLIGSPPKGPYKGVLFFQDRSTATSLTHLFDGGGGMSLTGTIYLTHTADRIRSDMTYQSLILKGGSGNNTKVAGEIITDALSIGGNSAIQMNLISTPTFEVRQVALVQ